MKITVPICNVCNKPHFGKRNVDDRCVCDFSGNYHFENIEEEPPAKGLEMTETFADHLEDIKRE